MLNHVFKAISGNVIHNGSAIVGLQSNGDYSASTRGQSTNYLPGPFVDNHYKLLKDQYGFGVENTPMGELRTVTPVRLVGATFVGNTLDPNFWVATTGHGGTITQSDGQVTISPSVSTTGIAILQSKRSARYIAGASNRFRTQIQLSDNGLVGNTRRCGLFDGTNGAYFKLADQNISVCTMKNGVESKVEWTEPSDWPTLTNTNVYEIYITNTNIYYAINDQLVKTLSFKTTPWTNTTNLPVRIDNINNGASTDSSIKVRVASIYRLGELKSAPTYKHLTAAGTYILKYGAGSLHSLCVNSAGGVGAALTIYDNIAGTGDIIGIVDVAKITLPTTIDYNSGISFYNGLTVVQAGTWDGTLIYE